MKNIVILLCLLFIVYSEPVSAQTQQPAMPQQDTLIIKLSNRNQVLIIGRSLKELTQYQRADSLKTWFFEDLEITLTANDFPETPKRIYYLVNQSGKRRLKAEIPGESEPVFNLEMEKKRLVQDLPPFHYTIYDLPKNVELHFLLEDTAAFALAANTNLTAAVQELNKDKKKLTGLSVYRLEQGGLGFEKRNPTRRTQFSTEALGYIGASLIGSTPSPVISYDFIFSFSRKPRANKTQFRFGFSYNAFVLTDFKDNQFQNVNPGSYWHVLAQTNFGLDNKNWFGITGGQFSTKDEIGIPNNAFKFGLQADFDRNSFSFESIDLEKSSFFKTGRRKQLYLFTYRRSIL